MDGSDHQPSPNLSLSGSAQTRQAMSEELLSDYLRHQFRLHFDGLSDSHALESFLGSRVYPFSGSNVHRRIRI